MITIADCDISVVVQGPVHALPDRPMEPGITKRALSSVRQHLPKATLILSTWKGQALDGLDYDVLIENEDPGPNVASYRADGTPRKLNHNRQIVSTRNGLRAVETPYAVKLRTDNCLTGDGFRQIKDRYPKRCSGELLFNERVVIVNLFTRRYAKGYRVLFHPSDFFHFGRKDDLLKLWDIPFFENFPYDPNLGALGLPQHRGVPEHYLDPVQELFLACLKRNWGDRAPDLKHLLDRDPAREAQWETLFANNFVVASPQELGLYLGAKFTQGVRVARRKGRAGFYTLREWERLYKSCCDPGHTLRRNWQADLELHWDRLRAVHPRKLETWLNMLGKRARFQRRAASASCRRIH